MRVKCPVFMMIPALLAATAACAPVGRSIQRIGTHVHEETVAMDHRVRDWFDSENQAMLAGRDAPAPTTAYCYKTLSDVSCYGQPIPGQERRLVGKQIPEPVFAALNTPVPETKPEAPAPEMVAANEEGEVLVMEKVAAASVAPKAAVVPNGGSGDVITAKTAETIPDYRKPRTLIPVFDGKLN